MKYLLRRHLSSDSLKTLEDDTELPFYLAYKLLINVPEKGLPANDKTKLDALFSHLYFRKLLDQPIYAQRQLLWDEDKQKWILIDWR